MASLIDKSKPFTVYNVRVPGLYVVTKIIFNNYYN